LPFGSGLDLKHVEARVRRSGRRPLRCDGHEAQGDYFAVLERGSMNDHLGGPEFHPMRRGWRFARRP
jgi:hypothetical protein